MQHGCKKKYTKIFVVEHAPSHVSSETETIEVLMNKTKQVYTFNIF